MARYLDVVASYFCASMRARPDSNSRTMALLGSTGSGKESMYLCSSSSSLLTCTRPQEHLDRIA
eukprot:4088408-Amphidinium_carterae.1